MERYYLKVKGMQGPTVAHDSLAEAYAEARRLFEITGRDRRVYVLQVIGAIEPETKEERKARRRLSRQTAAESQQTVG